MGLLKSLFGCAHKRQSFPITLRANQRPSAAASLTGTYVVCLDCGHEIPYDWKSMKLLRGRTKKSDEPPRTPRRAA